jgi:hypothetical protein
MIRDAPATGPTDREELVNRVDRAADQDQATHKQKQMGMAHGAERSQLTAAS